MIRAFIELSKPGLSFSVALAAAAGYLLGAAPADHAGATGAAGVASVLGITLLAAGTAALNMVMEAREDGLMERTRRRPIPSGRIPIGAAAGFGAGISLLGLGFILQAGGANPFLLGMLAQVLYLGFYTPMKRITPLCNLPGAIAGAAPLLIGAAAAGGITIAACCAFLFLLIWQIPHVMAIGRLYREDYAKAGYRVTPTGPGAPEGIAIATRLAAAALCLAPLAPGFPLAGPALSILTLASVGVGLIAWRFARERTELSALHLARASRGHLLLFLALLAIWGG